LVLVWQQFVVIGFIVGNLDLDLIYMFSSVISNRMFVLPICSTLSTTIFGFVLAKMYLGFLSFVFSLGFPAVLNTTALYKCRLPDTSRYQNKTYLILDLIIRMRSFTDYNTTLGLD
jgi:hypothetical protein